MECVGGHQAPRAASVEALPEGPRMKPQPFEVEALAALAATASVAPKDALEHVDASFVSPDDFED